MTAGKRIPGPGTFVSRMLFQNGRSLFAYEMIYFFIIFLLINPVINYGIRWAMKEAGYSYLTSENLLKFLSKPATAAVAAGFLVVGGFLLLYGFSIIMTLLLHGKRGRKIRFFSVLLSALKGIWVACIPKNILLTASAILMFCFFNIIFLMGIGSRIRMPRYFMESMARIGYLKPVLIGLAVFLAILSFLMLFLLPYCILEHKSFCQGFKSSLALIKRKWLRSLLLLILWNGIIAVLVAVAYCLAIGVCAVFVRVFVQKYMAAAVFLMIYEHVNLVIGCLAALLGLVINSNLVTCLYFYFKWEEKEKYQETAEPPQVFRVKKRFSKKVMLAVAVAVIFLDVIYIYDLVYNGRSALGENLGYIEITSHRGYSSKAPENTIPAIELAMEYMADYVEIDVQETKDGVLVLFHDWDLYRVTGKKGSVRNLNYHELTELDAGLWFGEEYRGTKIPTLEETLELCKGKVNLNIEIKNGARTKQLNEKVVEMIEAHNFERQCVITSARYEDLVTIKELNQDLKTGYILAGGYGNFYNNNVAADFFSMKSNFVTDRLVRKIHEKGKAVHVWTVNSKKEMERMKQLEVDNIITDKPILARELIYQEESRKTLAGLLNLIE